MTSASGPLFGGSTARALGQLRAGLADVPGDELLDHAGPLSQAHERAEAVPVVIRDADHPVRGVGLGKRHVHRIAVDSSVDKHPTGCG